MIQNQTNVIIYSAHSTDYSRKGGNTFIERFLTQRLQSRSWVLIDGRVGIGLG